MTDCIFVSDLHGRIDRYDKLLAAAKSEAPAAVFIGGDMLPAVPDDRYPDLVRDYLLPRLEGLLTSMGPDYPAVFAIPGNDDYHGLAGELAGLEEKGLLCCLSSRSVRFRDWTVFGYAFTPPSPFLHKDWEKYDVSRYVDPGCVSPERGRRTTLVTEDARRYGTIEKDLAELTGGEDLGKAVFLFHAPPYRTMLDRAALDGKYIDSVPMDVHVGSIAVRRLIEERQPLLTLHGHIHESARLTGVWKELLGRTVMISAAHDGPELALVRFSLEDPGEAGRELI